MNAFACAIKMEEEARQYYEELIEATAVPELKGLFSMLAAAEQEHHAALVALQADIPLKEFHFTDLKEAACLFKPLLERRDTMDSLPADPDAYRQIVNEEENGIRIYEELAAQQHDQRVREALLLIADQERKHLSIVENIYAFVESPRTFLAWGEFSNLAEY